MMLDGLPDMRSHTVSMQKKSRCNNLIICQEYVI